MTKWKFLVERSGRIESMYGRQVWTPSEWVEFDGALRLYHSGLHASPDPLSAMGYVAGDLLATVSTRGDSIESDDKSVHEAMRLDKVYRWRKEDSVALAVFSAELVIQNYEDAYPGDMRPRNAIEAAKAWLAASADSAASSAVWLAAEDASSAADSAAWSAAWLAAEDASSAADSAAWSAAWSAESVAWRAAESAESVAWRAAESARTAAWSAVWSADSAASSAVWLAAEDARSAANSAAWAAAESARSADSAARSAAWSAARDDLKKRISGWIVARTQELPEWEDVHAG